MNEIKKPGKIAYVSPFVWAGSKLGLVKYMEKYWEPHKHRRMVEPFSGSLAVSFSLKCPRVLGNDLNKQLINAYRELSKAPVLDIVIENESDLYYQYRNEFNSNVRQYEDIFSAPDEVKRRQAELFYYLNRYCFNGLWRVNSKGEFNVSFANYKYARGVQDLSHFFNESNKDWEFISGDFSDIKLNDDEDFVFADPPYTPVSKTADFTSYTKEGFTWADQIRVCEWLRDFRGPAIICNQRLPETEALYRDYGYELINTKRPKNFSGKKSEESKQEIMAIKNV